MQHLFDRIQSQEPQPTGHPPQFEPLSGIRAVLFDIYGTLLISSSGDISSSEMKSSAAEKTFQDCDIELKPSTFNDVGHRILHLYHEEILIDHKKNRDQGFPHPEVDIVEIWKAVTQKMLQADLINASPETIDHQTLAFTFETHNNAVYPMPLMEETLKDIQALSMEMGIVSNAQFFSPMLLKHFLGVPQAEALPYFHPDLQVYSYQLLRAKPDNHLYTLMAEKLKKVNLSPTECLYVGNDMLNDIVPAAEEGFKTVLYAGDQRSLRLREDHPRCQAIKPDRVVTTLPQLLHIIS